MKKLSESMKKFYEGSELRFAIAAIVLYVLGNSLTDQLSKQLGPDMCVTLVYDLLFLTVLLSFFRKHGLLGYYGLVVPEKLSGKALYYLPLMVLATVNLWFGIRLKGDVPAVLIYFAAMLLVGTMEELLFRGLLFRAMSREDRTQAIILTSVLFGLGHIINLFNGSGAGITENLCQVVYAVSIGFLLAAVLERGKSLIPCILFHAVFNGLSAFSNEAAFEENILLVSAVISIVAAAGAVVIFMQKSK